MYSNEIKEKKHSPEDVTIQSMVYWYWSHKTLYTEVDKKYTVPKLERMVGLVEKTHAKSKRYGVFCNIIFGFYHDFLTIFILSHVESRL